MCPKAERSLLATIALVLGLASLTVAASAWGGQSGWMAPAAEKGKRNPIPREVAIPLGKESFERNCSACHGATGKGDGPASGVMQPKPRNLGAKAVQAQTDGELLWKITTGRGAMPPWASLSEKERWSLVAFIRGLAAQSK
jgi:mono/diheme cytochrome c family protein